MFTFLKTKSNDSEIQSRLFRVQQQGPPESQLGDTTVSDRESTGLPRRTVLRAAAGAVGVAGVSGVVAGSQHDVDVGFSNETGNLGERVPVSLDIAPANNQNVEVGAYDIEFTYDETVVSFIEMNGVDLADPTVNEPSPGRVAATVAGVSGTPVPLTAATVVFEIDSGAADGDVATVALDDTASEFTDPIDQVTFESQDGSIEVVTSQADYQLSNLDPETATVFEGDPPIDVSADVTNAGSGSGTQDLGLTVADDQSGDIVYSDTVADVVLNPGNSQTVTFQDVPAGTLSIGDYTHTVDSLDDSVAGSLTVVEQPDVVANFSDESGDIGEQISVSFDIDPSNDPNAEVGSYDIEINYDETIVSFVETNGVDLADPVASEPSPGTITANVGQTTGEPVPLTAATVVFEIDSGAADGDVTTVALNDANSEFFDPVDPVTFESQDGSVTVSTANTDYQLSNLDPETATVFEGAPPIDVSADVVNNGPDPGTQELLLSVTDDQSGDVVYSDTVADVVLNPGNSQTVTFQDVPAGTLSIGDYTHTVDSLDDSVAGSLTVEEEPDIIGFQLGDVNTDGEVSIVDVVLMQQHIAGMNPQPFSPQLADLDRSGGIGIVDVVLLQQFIAGTRTGSLVKVDEVTTDATTVTAQLQNTGEIGALGETQLWIAAAGTKAEQLLTGYRVDDPPTPGQLASQIRTDVHDLAPGGGQGAVEFDIGGLTSGSYRGLVYTGDDVETFSFQVD